MKKQTTNPTSPSSIPSAQHHFRFHAPLMHLDRIYGNDWFALKAEKFARFFGTPIFLGAQTLVVTVWIVLNVVGVVKFDVYPFILLNLAFSLQAAYAAPLILLAQTRQSDRDKAHADADAKHREALAMDNQERQNLMCQQTAQLLELMRQNTELTAMTKDLSLKIETLTREIHQRMITPGSL